MLRVIELSKAAVGESSTECTGEGRLAPSLNHLVFEPKCLFCLVSAGQDGWQLIPHMDTVSLWQCHHSAPTPVSLTCTCSHGTVPGLTCCQCCLSLFVMLSKHPAF